MPSPTELKNFHTNVESVIAKGWATTSFIAHELKIGKHDLTRMRQVDRALQKLKKEKRIYFCRVKRAWCIVEETDKLAKKPEQKTVSRLPKDIFEVGDYAVVHEYNGYEKVVLVRIVEKNRSSIYALGYGGNRVRFDPNNGSRIPKPGPMGIPYYKLEAYDPEKHPDNWFDPALLGPDWLKEAKADRERRLARLEQMKKEGR